MKIAIVYCCPYDLGQSHVDYTHRFIETYNRFPPGIEHDSVVVLNGTKETSELCCLFSSLQNCRFLEHDDSGYDIGAYQKAAREVSCDFMVFFGGSTYFKRAGWLLRMATAFQKHGRALYGTTGNRGEPQCGVSPHVRTTGFAMPPDLFNQYPVKVTRNEQRYPAEHGANCITTWVTRQGLKAWIMAWDGEYQWAQWDLIPNGFHQGSQENLLCGDRLTEPPYHPVP